MERSTMLFSWENPLFRWPLPEGSGYNHNLRTADCGSLVLGWDGMLDQNDGFNQGSFSEIGEISESYSHYCA